MCIGILQLESGRLKKHQGTLSASVKRTHKGPLRDTLAKNMRRLRAARKLTREAIAYDCGINRTYLSAIERSERIAKGLGVAPWKLLEDD
jgi:DNA-binding XRE family transcriptional regulator